MRIADRMMFDTVNSNLGKNREELQGLQNQAATQKRVTKPSDDPVAATRVLADRIELSGNEQYQKNINFARSFLDYSDQSLGELTELLVRAKEVAISQANDASANSTSRRIVAEEINQIYDQMVQIGNRKLGERHLFGGYKTTDKPFDLEGNYGGDQGEMMIQVDKETFVAMNLPGSKIFHGIGLHPDGVTRTHTRQAATVEELFEQEALKDQRELERLKKLREQRFEAPSDGNLEEVEVRAPASIQEKKTDSRAQRINEAGTNIFETMKRLEIALRTNDKAGVQDSLDFLDESISQVVLGRSQIGSRSMVLNHARGTLEQQNIDTQAQISHLEDADVYSVVTDINKKENTLQATLETSGRMMQKSLMDFLG